jgi:hypothetical protein
VHCFPDALGAIVRRVFETPSPPSGSLTWKLVAPQGRPRTRRRDPSRDQDEEGGRRCRLDDRRQADPRRPKCCAKANTQPLGGRRGALHRGGQLQSPAIPQLARHCRRSSEIHTADRPPLRSLEQEELLLPAAISGVDTQSLHDCSTLLQQAHTPPFRATPNSALDRSHAIFAHAHVLAASRHAIELHALSAQVSVIAHRPRPCLRQLNYVRADCV